MGHHIEGSVTPEQFAVANNINVRTVYNLVKDGSISAFRIGRSIRILESELSRIYTSGTRPRVTAPDFKLRQCGPDGD